MELNKESKIRVLENFYALDYALFGKPVKEMTTCCPELVEEYVSGKGALLSVMIEIYKLVDHSPDHLEEKIGTEELKERAKRSASIAREMSGKLVSSSKGRADVKLAIRNELKEGLETDIEQLAQTKIREKAFSLSVDNLLIAKTISESKNYTNLNDWEGEIVEDAYKILRDSLVESAILIVDYGTE